LVEGVVKVVQNVVIREAQDAIAVHLEVFGACGVVRALFRIDVPSTVDLDHQSTPQAAGVEDEASERLLPAEAKAVDLSAPKRVP